MCLKNNMSKTLLEKIKSQGFVQGIFIMTILIAIDQSAKFIVTKNLHYTCNFGVAFGIRLPNFVFIIVWSSIMIYVFYLWQEKINGKFFSQLPLVLIISGGLSNVIDRAIHGCVIDFIPFLNISDFNLADSFITLGVLLIILINKE